MNKEVENNIKKKMERALSCWKRAHEDYEKGYMEVAAKYYAVAMRLYYECVTDLIYGTGFKEVERRE